MKKTILIILILFFANNYSFCQYQLTDSPDVLEESSSSLKSTYTPFGGCFTPKGDLRALIIFASFGSNYDNQDVGGWPNNSALPDWVNTNPFYATEAEFQNADNDNNVYSVSNFYYQMSGKTFRLFVDYYPQRIILDANDLSCGSMTTLNRKVIAKMPSNFDWSPYDRRKNHPGFSRDNSSFEPDNKPDFVIICYRFDWSWTSYPISGMNGWIRPGNGEAHNYLDGVTHNGYTFTGDGFTHMTGSTPPMAMFIHETAHTLFNAPHYNGNNSVSGDYFYMPIAGWGTMIPNTFTSALGYERWLLGWINIEANGANSYIANATDLPLEGKEFVLRDFITTGDVIRIKIPNGESDNQFLWIENHQGKSIFDNRQGTPYCDGINPEPERGVVAYVETFAHDRNYQASSLTKCNAIRYLHADGNYDFSFNPTPLSPPMYCTPTNITYDMHKEQQNPIGGQNVGEQIRNDFNNDDIIEYNTKNSCNSDANERARLLILDVNITSEYALGKGIAFQSGRKVGMAENPCIINVPKYNGSTSKMNPFYLNGISFQIINQNRNGDVTIKVKFKDVAIDKNLRWAGSSIILNDITLDNNPDVDVLSGVTLTIDKSGTPNRHTSIAGYSGTERYVNPTLFTCENNALFNMRSNSKVDVSNSSALILNAGSTYTINENAVLSIKAGSTLCIKSGANLRIEGSGNIIIEDGGYLCIEQGANINLVAGASLIKLYEGAHLGVNESVLGTNNNCISSIDNISITGCGAIIDNVITETTGNETWTTPKTLGEDFTVKSGHTLTIQNTTISLTPRVKIKIEPNAKLIIDNSKLTSYIGVNNCEGDYWGAIEVYGNKNQRQLQQYQGYLELKNNSIIENARNAVSLWKSDDWNSMGGIVNASNTTFKNNIRSVEFVSYQNLNQNNEEIDNVNKFMNCTFEWDANMYPHDKTNLNHVTLWNVKGVKFIACDFKNTLTNNNEIPKLGIYSEEAGFGVYGKLIPVPTGLDIERSEFHNLTYGVRAENISNSKNFIVQNSYFENNFCGIFTVASNNITIQDNEFRIHPIYKPQEDYPNYAAFGVTVHNCARYQIQRNDFIGEESEYYYKIGTQIKNSGEGTNRVNDNNFINLFQASQAIGNNRGINNRASTGLKYICNHFEDSEYGIVVTPDNQYRTNGIAINQDGGDITLSAENTFAQNSTLLGSDIFNDNTSGINYYSTQIGNKKPIAITSLVYNCLATENNGVCSKNYGLLDNITLNNTFVALENDYISLLYNYNNLLDGGSTDDLLDKIQKSWDGDVWNTRKDFLGRSPYLSPKVLKELALSEKLPLPVYLEIALSNPEATQKDEYIDFMKSDKGINILTTNGIELIKDSWDTKTFRSTLESNISSKLSDMEEITRTQLDRTINDTTGFNIANYRSLLYNIRNIEAKYELVDSYIETKEYANARGMLNSLLTDPEIAKYNETDINDYLSLVEIMEGRDSTNQMPLNEKLIDLSKSTTRAGSKARAYLNFYDSNTNYHPDYIVIDNEKSVRIKTKRPLNAFEADVNTLPNPAKDYIAISYNLRPQATEYMIKIYDNKGIVVYSGSLKGNKGIQNIDTRGFSSGTYVYNVENGNERFKRGKFIIVR